MKRVLVTGSRDWEDIGVIADALENVYREYGGRFVLVHGDALGADRMAARLADGYFWCPIEAHPAVWRPHGIYNPQAGLLRNSEMISLGADLCLAFIRNGSPGATDCANKAEAAGIEVRRFEA